VELGKASEVDGAAKAADVAEVYEALEASGIALVDVSVAVASMRGVPALSVPISSSQSMTRRVHRVRLYRSNPSIRVVLGPCSERIRDPISSAMD
jgi:hypothetical protein